MLTLRLPKAPLKQPVIVNPVEEILILRQCCLYDVIAIEYNCIFMKSLLNFIVNSFKMDEIG